MAGWAPVNPPAGIFADARAGDWFTPHVEAFYAHTPGSHCGVDTVSGKPLFCPLSQVTRAYMAQLLVGAFSLGGGTGSTLLSISGGGEHTCALLATGGVKCWGTNEYGQLGDGTRTYRATPVDVVGLSSGVTAISAGWQHTCALLANGGVKCWGSNYYGQLGDGTAEVRVTPTNVSGVQSGATSVSAGAYHTCAVVSGGAKCWGYNDSGGLGDGSTTDRTSPVPVSGLANGVTAVRAGAGYSCALLSSGGVKCWGDNEYGQLGNNSPTYIPVTAPVNVTGLQSGVSTLFAGMAHACAVVSGGLKCWGRNLYGAIGDGTLTDRAAPVNVSGLQSGVTDVSAGQDFTCAKSSTGVKCWGLNSSGQLGDGSTTNRSAPVPVTGLSSGIGVLSTGDAHACVTLSGGGAKCWGSNLHGQIRDYRDWAFFVQPVDVLGL